MCLLIVGKSTIVLHAENKWRNLQRGNSLTTDSASDTELLGQPSWVDQVLIRSQIFSSLQQMNVP